MKLKSILFASAFSLFAGFAQAAVTTDSVAADFQAQGFTAIEIKQGLTQIKVEAIKDGMKTEVIYDIATGAVLKTEVHAVRAGDDIRNGVVVKSRNRDFVKGAGNSSSDDSDDNDDDSNDDNGGDDHDDDRDDDHSDDDGDDDRGDDDHNDDSNDD